jgi:hypothetical protein
MFRYFVSEKSAFVLCRFVVGTGMKKDRYKFPMIIL